MYHNYVGEVTWCRIFWWFNWSSSSLSSHSSYFFEQVQFHFYNLDCCLHILGMLGINRSYTCHSFIVWWSPYSFGCSSTCWEWHFLVPNGITKYTCHVTLSCLFLGPIFWEFNGLILFPITSFFGGLPTWIKVYFDCNKCSFRYHVNTYLLMCGSKDKRLVISSSYHTYISYIFIPFPYNTMYPSWLAMFYGCPFVKVSMWLYHQ